jgi:hypothetical protein
MLTVISMFANEMTCSDRLRCGEIKDACIHGYFLILVLFVWINDNNILNKLFHTFLDTRTSNECPFFRAIYRL